MTSHLEAGECRKFEKDTYRISRLKGIPTPMQNHNTESLTAHFGFSHFKVTRRRDFLRNRFNPQAPVAQKIADEVVFQRLQGEGVEFF